MTSQAQHHSREDARERLTAKLAHAREFQARWLADQAKPAYARTVFTTLDPAYIIADAEWRLRWINCAPEGANHQLAPGQDKDGVPMGGNYNENVGPCVALREARAARGLCPFSGRPLTEGRAA